MVVARRNGPSFEVITREKEVVRLGQESDTPDRLSPDAMDRAIDALGRMKSIAEAHRAHITAVATSAVREAANAADFQAMVHAKTGISLVIISGLEEARLIHLGVRQALPPHDARTLLVDIGGGSTEFVVTENSHIEFAQSLKLGAVRMTNRFALGDTPRREDIKNCRRHIESSMAALSHDLQKYRCSRAVVTSGTAETLMRIVSSIRDSRPPSNFNNYSCSRDDMLNAIEMVITAENRAARRALPGVDDKRADIILAGSLILREIITHSKIAEIVFSEFALREGVLLDRFAADDPQFDVTGIDAARDSVLLLARRCSVDLTHSSHVATLSRQLFDIVQDHYDIDESLGRLVEPVALLCNVGLAVAHSRHHHHSYYIIKNADLMGFNEYEIELIALACRYHRKGGPKESHPEYSRLSPEQQGDVDLLAGIIRIATALDRSHDQSTHIVSGSLIGARSEQTLEIGVSAPINKASLELNIYTAEQRSSVLEEFLGDPITFVAATSD